MVHGVIAELAQRHPFRAIVPVSATGGDNLAALQAAIVGELPESPPLFGPEDRTDRSLDFRIAETIREKLTLELNQEVPYGIAVEVEQRVEDEGRTEVSAVIWVERKGQKAIVIGDKGGTLKEAGRLARLDMEEMFDAKVHLETWVKVREGWSDDEKALRSLGFDESED